MQSAVYNASGKFGSSLSGGNGYTVAQPITGLPFTIRAMVKAVSSGSVEVAVGRSAVGWFGKAANNTAVAHFGSGARSLAAGGPGTDVTISTSINIADGAWHELELNVTSANTATFFVDGVLAGSGSFTYGFSQVNQYFGIRAFFNTADSATATFGWSGEIDQVAVFSAPQHSAAYTPSTTALTGSEQGLVALYALNGNGNDTVIPAAASAVVMTGPTSGSTGVASSDFSFSLNGDFTGTVSVTPSDGGAGGTFAPATVNVVAGSASTATYTASSTGAKTISAANNAGLANPATITYTAGAGPAQIAYNDSKIFYSPSNWDDLGSYMVSANPGAYARIAFSGTSVGVKVDVSGMVSAGLPAASYPIVRTVIDGATFVDTQLTSGTTAITRTGLSSGSHTLEVFFLAADINNGDRWVTPVSAVRISGFTLDVGAAVSTPARRSKTSLFFGDSIWEGYLSAGTVTTQPVGNNCLSTAIPFIARAIDSEYGTIAFSGQGYEKTGNNGVVVFPSSYNYFSSGRSRLSAGLFPSAPDYIFVQHGTNGTTTQADVQSMIGNLRTAGPNAKIFMIVPANGSARAQITAAVAAVASPNVILIDIGTGYADGIARVTGPNLYSLDGLHPNPLSNALVGAADARAIQAALDTIGPALTARTFTFQLATGTNSDGSLIYAANLTGAKISLFDEASPDLHTVARYKTATGTFNSTGTCSFAAQSTLAVGATGSVVVWIGANRYTSTVVAA